MSEQLSSQSPSLSQPTDEVSQIAEARWTAWMLSGVPAVPVFMVLRQLASHPGYLSLEGLAVVLGIFVYLASLPLSLLLTWGWRSAFSRGELRKGRLMGGLPVAWVFLPVVLLGLSCIVGFNYVVFKLGR